MHTTTPLSRRSFLKLGLLALGAVAAGPRPADLLEGGIPLPVGLARVTVEEIPVYLDADLRSKKTGKLKRDAVIELWEQIQSPHGPVRNPLWYRATEGYVHSAHLQRVDDQHLNPVAVQLESVRTIGEVTVPFTQSMRADRQGDWKPLYRLYFNSLHWVTGIRSGPDGADWYELKDERLMITYCVKAEHIRLLKLQDYSPLSAELPLAAKRIEVSIGEQVLRAYEEDSLVKQFKISSGLPQKGQPTNNISTETPLGSFHVSVKWPVRHMGDGYITNDLNAYELPGVPWNMFFHESGYALHGTYWHDNFGTRMSHGCVNVPADQALWLFRWTDPVYIPGKFYTQAKGTLVNIVE